MVTARTRAIKIFVGFAVDEPPLKKLKGNIVKLEDNLYHTMGMATCRVYSSLYEVTDRLWDALSMASQAGQPANKTEQVTRTLYVTDAKKWFAAISLVLRHDFEEEKNPVDGVCSVPGELAFVLEGFKSLPASFD